MPTTSNFGWTTPADTDLVKDGAAAIRTLGNGIDTSLIDLKGGTTGQILSKASNTDLDYTWIANDQGDITEVQAGTGISVASGTGPIPVITNTVATTFDAAGDLVYGTGADTFTKLSLGTAGKVLTVNSGATAPEWATPSSGPTWSLAASGSLSGNSLSLTSLTGKAFYVGFFLWSHDDTSSTRHPFMRLNNDSGNNYYTPFNGGPFAQFEPFGSDSRVNTDTRSNGVFIDMADTAMTYKPTFSINGNSQASSAGGWYNSTSAITRIDIYLTAGKNYDAGTYACWKLA